MSARPATASVPVPSNRSIVIARPRHRAGHWSLFFVLVLAAFFGLIYSRLSLDASAFDLDELQDRIVAEEHRQSLLQVDVARLQDPERVAIVAERLGLVYPEVRTQLTVDPVDERLNDIEARWAQAESRVRAQP